MKCACLIFAFLTCSGSPVFAQQADIAPSGLSNSSAPEASPFVETVFGLTIDDPFRWMERPERQQEMSEWIRAASAHTASELARLPGRARVAERLRALLEASVTHRSLRRAGDRLFFLRLDPGSNVYKLVVREVDGRERVLVDPAVDSAPPRAINNYEPSPNGRRVAYHVT